MVRTGSLIRRVLLAPLAWAAMESAIAEPARNTGLERTYLERAAIFAADKTCRLFTPGERTALESGLFQTRGELLRAGRTPAEVDSLGAEVGDHARTLGCKHKSITEVAATIRDSYTSFQKIDYMPYPGTHAVWEASRSRHDQWSAKQSDQASGAVFGLRRINKATAVRLAIAIPAKGPAPASARLWMRDTSKLADPWLGGVLSASAKLSPAPRSMAKPEWAGRLSHERDYLNQPVEVFYFSDEAQDRLEKLDPREAVELELIPNARSPGEKPIRIVFEAGDFRAARLFSEIPAPVYPAPKG
jgi:hypothetical protein